MLPENNEHHIMIVEKTHSSGADEWFCPTCGRRLILQWPPNYKKIVLVEGNENATHSGGKGGLSIGAPQTLTQEQVSAEDMPDVYDPNLAPWEQWMEDANFENLWDQDPQ